MKRFLAIAFLLFAFVSARAEDSLAPDMQFYPSIGIGWNQLQFRRPGGTVSANYKTVNMGLTATYGKFYGSVSGEWFGKANFRNGVDFTSVEREDQTLTIGTVIGRTNLFAGYTSAETKDDFLSEFHRDQGYFLGAGYDFRFRKSLLTLSIAYADLDGRIDKDGSATFETGKTQGLSYSLSLSGPFRRDLGYRLFARYRGYDFNSSGVITDKDILSLGATLTF